MWRMLATERDVCQQRLFCTCCGTVLLLFVYSRLYHISGGESGKLESKMRAACEDLNSTVQLELCKRYA